MKKIVTKCIIGILIISGFATIVISHDNKNINIISDQISISEPILKETNNYPIANIPEYLGHSLVKDKTNIFHSLIASTFLGGGSSDGGSQVGIALDKNGNVFVTGTTDSPDFPTTPGACDETLNGGSDIFISKFNADLTQLLASTFIGGSDIDETNRRCITINRNGNVLITGITNSADFPIANTSYDRTYNGNQDIFIIKLNNELSSVLSSTFLGGRSVDGHRCDVSINTDEYDNIYVSGMTGSRDFPTTQNSYSDSYFGGGSDFFIAKFDNNITSLKASTFFGGSENEEWAHVLLDDDTNVFVGGFTSSSDLPTTLGVYDDSFNGVEDSFAAKLNSDLSNLIACTYIGGSRYDNCYTMNIDRDGNILLGGHADFGFPTTPRALRRFPFLFIANGFVSKLSGDLSSLIASTFIPDGLQGSVCTSIDSDIDGNIIVAGYTRAFLFHRTSNAFDKTHNGGVDIFISKLNQNLSNLMYSTFLGGSGDDAPGSALIVNDDGTLYLGSGTSSHDFPTTDNAYDETFNGGVDCFITKLNVEV